MDISIISMWIRFEVPSPCQFDAHQLLKPLHEYNAPPRPVRACHYGRMDEFPEEYLLVITWHTPKDYELFRESKAWEHMLGTMQTYSVKVPDIKVVDHGRVMWYCRLGACRYLGVKFVYFPESFPPEKKEESEKIKSLHSNLSFRNATHLNWLVAHATRGWIEGSHTYKGEKASAYLWCHKWRNKEKEQDFNSGRISASEMAYLNHRLMQLAPLGWEEFHVHLQSWIDITWSDEELGDDEEDEEDGEDGED